ncbi:type VI secretion system baseplate subunit TssE [Massilia sp. CCM 8695]|uniref:Type VI secretion system baseplate subunit TssE n=1 Tax=Massilia frigida TaxID=2609281 RepID=A0ABX0NA32_9BURK|nr:type VI secretion system baseplate subunit TssE [Massilia frigida]NHZ82292.1 type VI secretion system baseplate subunit TssE [Massilia frigida]
MFKSGNQISRALHGRHDDAERLRLGARDRLRPALLERLTDHDRLQAIEMEPPGTSSAALRSAVMRDLVWLLNCTAMAADVDLDAYPQVHRSVLNYGILPLSGKHLSELDSQELAGSLRRAILAFEPRLLPDTLQVHCVSDPDSLSLHNELAFEIRAQLWSQPYPVEFLVRSDVDIETGHTKLHDLVAG